MIETQENPLNTLFENNRSSINMLKMNSLLWVGWRDLRTNLSK